MLHRTTASLSRRLYLLGWMPLFLCGLCAVVSSVLADQAEAAEAGRPPNIVILFADDLGYGDLGCYGHPTIRTPNLDRMAAEGMRFTQFYVAASICTPSRAGLMTGRLPIRTGMCSDRRGVLFPNSKGGLQADEITIAEALKTKGYATMCIGKWHLGHLPQFLPMRHGFDSYLGIPYSNDMDRTAAAPKGREAFWHPKIEYFNVPLMRNDQIVERPADQHTTTKRYTEEAVHFIGEHADGAFLLYLPYSLPHVPLFCSSDFQDTSPRGLYGDVVEEIDWSVGQILDALRTAKVDQNTLVLFSSDNGPWLIFGEHGGSAGLLRDGKGSTWEGGMREPGIAWWPGHVPAGTVTHELASTLDMFATVHSLAGIPLPRDRVLDSYDLTPVLLGKGPGSRDRIFYYRGTQLRAVRLGPWKAHFITRSGYGGEKPQVHDPPLLFHLEHDPSERFNVAADHADVIERIKQVVAEHTANLKAPPSQLEL